MAKYKPVKTTVENKAKLKYVFADISFVLGIIIQAKPSTTNNAA